MLRKDGKKELNFWTKPTKKRTLSAVLSSPDFQLEDLLMIHVSDSAGNRHIACRTRHDQHGSL